MAKPPRPGGDDSRGGSGPIFDPILNRFSLSFDHLSELAADVFRNENFFWHLAPCGIDRGPLLAFPRVSGKSYGQSHFATENIRKREMLSKLHM